MSSLGKTIPWNQIRSGDWILFTRGKTGKTFYIGQVSGAVKNVDGSLTSIQMDGYDINPRWVGNEKQTVQLLHREPQLPTTNGSVIRWTTPGAEPRLLTLVIGYWYYTDRSPNGANSWAYTSTLEAADIMGEVEVLYKAPAEVKKPC